MVEMLKHDSRIYEKKEEKKIWEKDIKWNTYSLTHPNDKKKTTILIKFVCTKFV